MQTIKNIKYIYGYMTKSITRSSDLDECRTNTHTCHRSHGICTNTYGSFKCSCQKPGFEGNGFVCKGENTVFCCFVLYDM